MPAVYSSPLLLLAAIVLIKREKSLANLADKNQGPDERINPSGPV
jgi:hypothetical protein